MAPKIATPLDSLPVGRLGIIPLKSCEKLGAKVNDYIVKWRKDRDHQEKNNLQFEGYERSSYLINAQTPRFGSGEAKGILEESVRGDDLYLMVDVCNYSLTYSLCGHTNHMSPDDHFQDLKRIIAAVGGESQTGQCHYALPLRKPSAQKNPERISGLCSGPSGADQYGSR